VNVIHNNEATERRELIGSERYEFLVLKQKQDTEFLAIERRAKMEKLQAKQQRVIAKVRGTGHGAETVSDVPQLSRSHGVYDKTYGGRTNRKHLAAIASRVTAGKTSEQIEREKLLLMEKEATLRAELHDAESRERLIVWRIEQHNMDAHDSNLLRRTEDSMVDAQRRFSRLRRDLDAREVRARDDIIREESASWTAVDRHWLRASLEVHRRWDRDVTRQITHQRKISDRQQRMAFTRAHFRERQRLLVEESAGPSTFPLFSPRPPETLSLQRRVSIGEASTELQIASRRNVEYRQMLSLETASRTALERDERLERFSLVSQYAPAKPLPGAEERKTAAATRRIESTQLHEARVLESIASQEERVFSTLHGRQAERGLQRKLEGLSKQQSCGRLAISKEESLHFSQLQDALCATRRTVLLLMSLVDSEMKLRKQLMQSERSARGALRSSATHHKPQSRVIKVVPLPPPKSMADFVFDASLFRRPDRLDPHPPKTTRKTARRKVSYPSMACAPAAQPPATRDSSPFDSEAPLSPIDDAATPTTHPEKESGRESDPRDSAPAESRTSSRSMSPKSEGYTPDAAGEGEVEPVPA